MCLTLKEKSRKVTAKKDIVVYKFLTELPDGNLQTPYKDFNVEIGNTYTSLLLLESYHFVLYICDYGLHSYSKLEDAKDHTAIHDLFGKVVFAKCIIPKGAKYYKGTFNGSVNYASDELIYVELVK